MSIGALLMLGMLAWAFLLVAFVGLCMAAKRAEWIALAGTPARRVRRPRGTHLRRRRGAACASASWKLPPRRRSAIG
jgi:hypothetical protein